MEKYELNLPEEKYIAIAETIIDNLGDSDWLYEAGGAAYRALAVYKLDIALDIQKAIEGTLPKV